MTTSRIVPIQRGASRRRRSEPQDVVPKNTEAERSVLAVVLLQNEAIESAAAVLKPDDFFHECHKLTFAHMLRLRADRIEIDLVSVKESLARSDELDKVGGPAYLAALLDGMPRLTNVAHYASIVRKRAFERRAVYACERAAASLRETPAESGLILAELRAAIAPDLIEAERESVARSLPTLLAALGERSRRECLLGDLIALGEIAMLHGQPRDGKTWVSLEIAIAAALAVPAFDLPRLTPSRPCVVLIVSNEDAEHRYADRARMLLAGRGVFSAPDTIHFIVGLGCNLDDPSWQARLITEAKRLGAELIILDPLRSLTSAVDQGPSELQPLASYLRRLVRETGAALLAVHHDTKPPAGIADTRRRAQRASGGAIFSNRGRTDSCRTRGRAPEPRGPGWLQALRGSGLIRL